jgi:hypothetical protein
MTERKIKIQARIGQPTVAERVQKGELPIDLALANGSCKGCHGTGVYGRKLNRDGTGTMIVCPCVAKAMESKYGNQDHRSAG